jgi:hypothetical protein
MANYTTVDCLCFLDSDVISSYDEQDFFASLDSIFAGYTGSKSQVQNRQKIKFIKLYLQKIDISKIKCS